MASKKEVFKGIDISRHQKIASNGFKAIKDSGIDFVIIRIGGSNGGHYKDPKFEEFYKGAKEAGLKVGCYYDTGRQFTSRLTGLEDAQHMLKLMEGKSFEYPVYADVEVVATPYRALATDATIAFCDALEKAGYFAGVYASDISGFKERLILDKVKRFTLWVARYGKKPEYVKKYDIHQYSSSGIVSGIQNKVDLDESYVDFASIIKKKHLNRM